MQMLGPIATILVSLCVAYIAWQQWQVARNKLRLDLFERRYKIYEATRKFLGAIVQKAFFTEIQLHEYNVGTSDAEFLFGIEIVACLNKIYERAISLQTHQKVGETLPVGEERSLHGRAQEEHVLCFGNQLTTLSKTFAPYLDFSQIQVEFLVR